MKANYQEIEELLQKRADNQARLNLIPYKGTPEVQEENGDKHLYMRIRENGKLKYTYVGEYTDYLYQLLLKNSREARELTENIRKITKQLNDLEFEDKEIPLNIAQNIDFARINMKVNIYEQAMLEGVGTTFPQTEEIIENGIVNGVSANDVQKILNLKHAWEFILDKDVIQSDSNLYMLCYIAKFVNEGFFKDGGRLRGVPVTIGGCKYIPPIPIEVDIKETIEKIKNQDKEAVIIAIDLCLYCMRTQIFTDGNKRAAVIFANHYLISHGKGVLVVPEKNIKEFKKLLVNYYEHPEDQTIHNFMKENCWKKLQQG